MVASSLSKDDRYLHPSEGDLKYILTVLASIDQKLDIPWKEIAPLLGVNRWDNAQSKFRQIGTKLGWRSYGGPGPSTDPDLSPFKRTPSKKAQSLSKPASRTPNTKRVTRAVETPTPGHKLKREVNVDKNDDEKIPKEELEDLATNLLPITPQPFVIAQPTRIEVTTPKLPASIPFPVLTPTPRKATPRIASVKARDMLREAIDRESGNEAEMEVKNEKVPPKIGALTFGDENGSVLGYDKGSTDEKRVKRSFAEMIQNEDSCDEDGEFKEHEGHESEDA